MKFLIISDTHGNFNAFNNVVEINNDIDIIFFLGDGTREAEDIMDIYPQKTVYAVSGNCDLMSLAPSTNIATISEGKILYTHGDAFGVKCGLGKLHMKAKSSGVKIALFGHTHIPFYEEREEIHLFNPGSLGQSGKYGICTIQNGNILFEHKEL